ncbi:uncharacterized protein C6orf141 homolog [Erinaceus europaeus]|uniref:Uncharacterized protein C6orf141 homolog n=1 Tax=Erinaceus europaeus TaxID=9365 RepID=A0A1S2ZR98_ERIEU|nr:uncharacterized protein C6orf141 homolog [Erinaceus europaeus]
MNEPPPRRLGARSPRGAENPADLRPPERAPWGGGVARGFQGAPRAEPRSCGHGGGPDGAPEDGDSESWVRDKVLFLLHPERWLGTPGQPARAEGPPGEQLPGALGSQHPGLHGPPPAGPPGDRVPRPVLVRVEDYQVTREVMQTAWTRARLTTRTEERSVTAVTFRASRA